MSSFDIRGEGAAIDTIMFGDKGSYDYYAEQLSKQSTGFRIEETDYNRYLAIKDREHADNLIKAINKARELGWI